MAKEKGLRRVIRFTLTHKDSKSGVYSIANPINVALRKMNAADTPMTIDEENATVTIPQGLTSREAEGLSGRIKAAHTVDYIDESQIVETRVVEKYPTDYGLLKGQVKEQGAQLSGLRADKSGLETALVEERSRAQQLQTQVRDLMAKYGAKDVLDLHTEVMTRENSTWENFTRAYVETLQIVSELHGIPVDVLERECLDYKGLEEREDFQKIENDFRTAEENEKIVSERSGLRLEAYAQSVLEKGRRIIARDGVIREARDNLALCVVIKGKDGKEEKRRSRIDVRVEGEDTVLTLPYKFKEQYPTIEGGLIDSINSCLTEAEVPYKQEGFNGLLRYRIIGIGTRARNRLFKAIKSCEDPFTKLGGEREFISIGVISS